jgi:hypothetical protein
MGVQTVEFKPFQDQKPGTYVQTLTILPVVFPHCPGAAEEELLISLLLQPQSLSVIIW